MLNNTVSALRVSRFSLILGLALVAVPGFGLIDRPAAAREVSSPAPAVTSAVEIAAPDAPAEPNSAFEASAWDAAELGGVDSTVFELALEAAATAVERGEATPATLTVIDFSQPSTEERMWVYDLASRELLFKELVSHGRGSGMTMAKAFSNRPESYQSSIGLYRTAETYIGKHGYSLRLDGLDRGFNDRARERAIVMHAADYVNAATARANGYLGRSHGCPALRPEISRELIDTVKGGGLVFAYYPDQTWLEASEYLN